MLIFDQEGLSQESLKAHIKAVDTWLESNAVISQYNDNRGAVAGALDINNEPLYWYSEIAGYYLSYLSCRAQSAGPQKKLTHLVSLILKYQKEIWSASIPPSTRTYTNPIFFDWRNQGLFVFDIAMLLRGIADCSTSYNRIEWNGSILITYLEHFFSTSQQLQAVHWLCVEPVNIPIRWSTQAGVYQLKVIAGLLKYARTFDHKDLEKKLILAANSLVLDFNLQNFSLHNAHSICYALEGALLLQDDLPLNLTIGKSLIEELADNALNKTPYDQEAIRSDVIAQLLRLTCCEPYFNFSLASKLAQHLQIAIQSDGGLCFTISPYSLTHKNVWPALFARQALDYFASVLEFGRPLKTQEYGSLF